ncbi:MAG: hypothetical protein KIS94_02275 [Chitinophagales bacterium]|nr:hypothetical protein [Chitinophagales bacterium]
MRKLILVTVLLISMAVTLTAQAQARVHVNINLQPVWGPVGYDYVEYYYLPDYEIYYHVPSARFVFLDGGNWIFASTLPPRFGTINYYTCYKVVVNQPKAYLSFKTHKVKYASYKGGNHKQVVIRDSRDSKYFVIKDHPHYGQSKKSVVAPSVPAKVHHTSVREVYKPSPSGGSYKSSGGNKGGKHGKHK